MPLSFRQAGNTFIQGPNISIYPSGNSYAISGNATSTGSTGFSAITSAGTGNILLLSSITNNALIYKSLTGTSNLSVNDDSNGTLTFSLSAGGTGTIISGVNIGTNANSLSFFSGLSTTTNPNDTLAFRNLLAGDNIFISPSVTNDGDIVINRGSPTIVNQFSNIGGGSRVLSAISSSNIIFARTLAGNSGFTQAIVNGPNAVTDSDATSFITAASITSTTHITAINNLVFDLKQNNLWNKMLAIYPVVGGNATSHSYNLKDPRNLNAAFRLVFSGGWTHSSTGMLPNGTNGYADTFLTAATSLSVSNGHLSFYSRSQTLSGTNIEIGASINSSAIICALAVGRSTNQSIFWWGNQGASTIAIFSSSSSQGFFIGNQNGATAAGRNIYRNASAGTAASNYNNSSLGAIPSITIGARNDVAGVDSFSTKQCSFASIGSGLTDTDISNFGAIVEAYQTTLGRQIVVSTTRLLNALVNITPTNTTPSLLYISNATSQLGTSALFGVDATTGSLGIGGAAVTTSRLGIAAGTGAISQIRLTAFSAEPTNPSDGSIWYSTSGNTLKFEKGTNPTDFIFKNNNISLTGSTNSILQVNTAGTISQRSVNSLGVFNTLTSLTVNTSETSIISSSLIGSTTLLSSTNPYNPQLGIGRKFRFNAKGILSFDISPINLNIIIKLGSTVISSSSTISVGGIGDPYSSEIEIDATFTIRNSGLVVCSGKIMFLTFPPSASGGLGDPVIFGLYSQDATIDTTSDKLFDCIVQLDPEEVTNTITINESTLEILN